MARVVALLAACAALALAAPLGLHAKGAGVTWAWSGAVTATGAVVKARVTRGDAPIRLTLGREDGGAALPSPIEAQADQDGVAVFALGGLAPATRYRYRIELEGAPALDGVLRTFPEGAANVRLAFASCARTGSRSAVFESIREAAPDVFIHMGDFHYEDIAVNDPAVFRRTYDRVLTSPTQGLLYRHVPIVYMWDDHDFGPNGSGGSSPSRSASLATYRQLVPHYPLADDGAAGIQQSFTIGRVRVIVTDTRSQRGSSRGPVEARTMLGARQLQWLKDQLEAARDAALVVWVSTVPWIETETSGGDRWGSYPAERRAIATLIDELGLMRRLVMVSGDAHMVALDDGSHTNYSNGPAKGTRGFPLIHAAPLDRRNSVKGGPYSTSPSLRNGQFGTLDVKDSGGDITVELTGRDIQGRPILGQRLALACDARACAIR
jgi:phosphodiesterase/alkaline phosphatase D-like protein